MNFGHHLAFFPGQAAGGLACLVLALSLAPAAFAADIPVGPTRSHTTVASGLAAASHGDRLLLDDGTYPENLVVARNVTIEAANLGGAIIDGGGGRVFDFGTFARVTLRGLVLRNGTQAVHQRDRGAAVTLERCIITGMSGGAVDLNNRGGTAGSYLVTHCVLDDVAVALRINDGGPITVRNSIIRNANIAYEALGDLVTPSIRPSHNLLDGVTTLTVGSGIGVDPGQLTGDPRFADAAAGDYSLQADSPALDSGLSLGQPSSGAGPDRGAWERLTFSSPPAGSCTPGPVTVTVAGGAAATLSGTITAGGISALVGAGPTYAVEGEYTIVARSDTGRGTIQFVVDATPPTIAIASPLRTPRPGEVPSSYRLSHLLSPETTDLPIAVDVSLSDDDGVAGGVTSKELLLDGQPLQVEVRGVSAAEEDPATSLFLGGHAIRLPGVPGGPVYGWADWEEAPAFHEFGDGTALLTGVVFSLSDPNLRWRVELRFRSVSAAPGGPRLELLPEHYAPAGPIDPGSWRTYELDPAQASTLTGVRFTPLSGLTLSMSQAPGGYLQVGLGANGRNLELGLSAWLTYSGAYSGSAELNGNLSGPPSVSLTMGVFQTLGVPVTGTHTLEVRASDACGNVAASSVSFEVALFGKPCSGLLFVDRDSVNDPSSAFVGAMLILPEAPGGSSVDPTYVDVFGSSFVLEGLDTGLSATATHATPDPTSGATVFLFPRGALLNAGGDAGATFRLRGRFFGPTGPQVVALDCSTGGSE